MRNAKPGILTIVQYGAWTLVLVALVFSLGFVSQSERKTVVERLDIEILNNDENLFLNENDVMGYMQERCEPIKGQTYSNISLPEIEKVLNQHPSVENAEVAATYQGELKVRVKQRSPLVRIINKSGESYYIDDRAMLMPLSDKYTARVLVANGELFEPYDRRYSYSVEDIAKSASFRELSKLDDIYAMARYIQSDSLLNALIHQIHVNQDGDLEVFPVFGCQRIVFGDTSNLVEKFNKLKLVYSQGMNRVDGWNLYSSLNLKYRNMVVCTKK